VGVTGVGVGSAMGEGEKKNRQKESGGGPEKTGREEHDVVRWATHTNAVEIMTQRRKGEKRPGPKTRQKRKTKSR